MLQQIKIKNEMNKVENRYLTEQSNLRAFVEEDKKIIEGRALVFNSESRLLFEDNKEFNEIIEKEALEETDFSRAYLTYNHSKDDVFASVRGQSLSTIKDDNGMLFRAVLNNTQKANDMYEMVRNGDIAGLSFNMVVTDQDFKYSRATDGSLKRTINKIRAIREISLIGGLWEPAYPETRVWARGLEEYINQEEKQADNAKMQRDNYVFLLKKIYK
jgi:HK97 family phage prohead protease